MSWLAGAVQIMGVLDASGLVAEVRRATTDGVTFAGTITVDGRRYPLAGPMPIPVPAAARFSPDAELSGVSFSGRRA